MLIPTYRQNFRPLIIADTVNIYPLRKAPEKLWYHIVNRKSNSPSNPVKSSIDPCNKRSKETLFKKLSANYSVPYPKYMIKKISPRARHKTAYWSNITWFEKHQASGIVNFRDFIEARGGERIFIEDAVATSFHVPIRSGLVSSNLRFCLF